MDIGILGEGDAVGVDFDNDRFCLTSAIILFVSHLTGLCLVLMIYVINHMDGIMMTVTQVIMSQADDKNVK